MKIEELNFNYEKLPEILSKVRYKPVLEIASDLRISSQLIYTTLENNGFDRKGYIKKRLHKVRESILLILDNYNQITKEELIIKSKLDLDNINNHINFLERKNMIIIETGYFGEFIRIKPLGKSYVIALNRLRNVYNKG